MVVGDVTSTIACALVAAKENFPKDLTITAVDPNGRIMGLRHNKYDVRGVQFHPESILTEHGELMIRNWLALGSL